MRHDDPDEERRRCGLCGKVLQPYDSISVAEVGERCSRWFNKELAERLGVDFDNTPIAPIVVTDVDGVRHRFEIRSRLVGTGHAMSAREIRKLDERGGYRFEVLGDFETDARDLFELLRERIREGLSVRHVEKTEHGWQLTQALRLSGVIEWDPETEGARPLLIVDGRTFTWDRRIRPDSRIRQSIDLDASSSFSYASKSWNAASCRSTGSKRIAHGNCLISSHSTAVFSSTLNVASTLFTVFGDLSCKCSFICCTFRVLPVKCGEWELTMGALPFL